MKKYGGLYRALVNVGLYVSMDGRKSRTKMMKVRQREGDRQASEGRWSVSLGRKIRREVIDGCWGGSLK